MATQTVVPALSDIAYGEGRAAAAPEPSTPGKPSRRARHLRGTVAALAFFGAVAAVEAWVPRFRHMLFTLIYPGVAMSGTLLLQYLREFHPERIPAVLEYGAPLRVKLRGIKRTLGWTAFASGVVGAAAVLANSCTCEDHPAIFMVWLVTMLGSCLGFLGVSAYLAVRTAPPIMGTTRSSARRHISGYKPFYSEHWGQARGASRPDLPQS